MHVLVASAALAYPGFHEAKALEPSASVVAHKRTIVWCADSDRTWAAFVDTWPIVRPAASITYHLGADTGTVVVFML